MSNKVIRSICYFADVLDVEIWERITEIANQLEAHDYTIQTKRICSDRGSIKTIDSTFEGYPLYLSVGALDRESTNNQLDDFLQARDISFNLDLSEDVQPEDADLLFKIVGQQPDKTFSFAYTFNNEASSPYFPSASYRQNGFSIGLQPTGLSEGCETVNEWLGEMKSVWNEVCSILDGEPDFLGIDSSVAPLFRGKSSLVNFIRRFYSSFSKSVTSDIYSRIASFIKDENPKPVGLCGIMFPCLEDFELAEEYEKGKFSIERNLFLSLHCGLGIDTYPVGIDEYPNRVFEILCLLQGLSQKHNKPLSARFVSDGKAKIGERTNLENQFLKDVVVRQL